MGSEIKSESVAFRDKVLVLRSARIGRVPPATFGTALLNEAGLPVLLLELDPQSSESSYVESPVPRLRIAFSQLHQSRWPKGPLLFWTLTRTLFSGIRKTGRPRLVIAHSLLEQAVAWLAKLAFGIPYIVHVHEAFDSRQVPPFNRFLLFLERFALRQAEFLIFPERGRERIYRERYRYRCPVFIVYNCPRLRPTRSPMALKRQLGISEDSFLLLYMGGIDHSNAIDDLVRALPQLPPQVHVALSGWMEAPFEKTLAQLVQEAGVASRVHLLGIVEPKWPVIDACDASFCVYRPADLRLTYLATASNKVMEAISAGLPLVVAGTENFREFIERYPVGVALEDFSPEAIARAIHKVMSSPAMRAEWRARGLALHRQELHFERQFQPVLEAIRERWGSPLQEKVAQ